MAYSSRYRWQPREKKEPLTQPRTPLLFGDRCSSAAPAGSGGKVAGHVAGVSPARFDASQHQWPDLQAAVERGPKRHPRGFRRPSKCGVAAAPSVTLPLPQKTADAEPCSSGDHETGLGKQAAQEPYTEAQKAKFPWRRAEASRDPEADELLLSEERLQRQASESWADAQDDARSRSGAASPRVSSEADARPTDEDAARAQCVEEDGTAADEDADAEADTSPTSGSDALNVASHAATSDVSCGEQRSGLKLMMSPQCSDVGSASPAAGHAGRAVRSRLSLGSIAVREGFVEWLLNRPPLLRMGAAEGTGWDFPMSRSEKQELLVLNLTTEPETREPYICERCGCANATETDSSSPCSP
eukprot:TRINITY_DN21811_c0_g1_i1.p1 TRINITY_DN21811_c0_g1~~TRINITY_DN21811_c0_g1_i1.p1  ORF type:complete len:358 (-),score=64.19 TRINITY_DN21811_c0_g1_i1:13-1086(-)